MEIRMGAYRHMESQPLQKGEYLCRGHRQYRYGHYLSSGVPAGGCHSSPLDKPGNVIFEEYRENPCLRQTRGMDHARYVAVHRHLPPCPRVHPLSAGVWQLSFHPRQRQQKRPLLPDLPQEAGVVSGTAHQFRNMQPLAGRTGQEKRPAHRTHDYLHPQPYQYQPV